MVDFDEHRDFRKWQAACAKVLAKRFPPASSDFGPGDLEHDARSDLSKRSNWALVCEEVLDTEHSHVYLSRCYEELCRRGKSDAEIQDMRRFVWHTAGWLNFSMMLWEWCWLDEEDIELAIEWLLRERQISETKRNEMLAFLRAHA